MLDNFSMRFKPLAIKLRQISLLVAGIHFGLLCTVTYAEMHSPLSTRPLEAWEQAQEYSLAHPVVAFAVYGRTQEFTAKGNAERIRKFLAGQHIRSKYFLADEQDMGSSVAFFLQGVSYGPVGLGKALPTLQKVVTHYKEEHGRSP